MIHRREEDSSCVPGVAPPQSEQVKFSGQNCAALQKSPSADCTSNCWEAQTDCMNRHYSCAHLRRSPAPSVLTSRCAVCINPTTTCSGGKVVLSRAGEA